MSLQHTAGNRATTALIQERLQARSGHALADHDGGPRLLEPHVRSRLEGHFNHKLDNLHVETGQTGQEVAERHRALAVSIDDTIYFGRGAYAPGTGRGDHILRHEAAHYLQRPQASGRTGPGWGEQALEAEARMAADRGTGPVPVVGTASSGQPLLMKTYVSTVGGNPYLEMAVKFYQLWENETAVRVGSYQDIVEKLAAEPKGLPEFRIVSHGSGLSLFLPLLTGAKAYAELPALGLQTREALTAHLGTAEAGVHLSADMTGTIVTWIQNPNSGNAALLARLGITGDPAASLKEWIWWAVDEYYAANVKEDKPVPKGPKQTTPGDVAALRQEVKKFQAAVQAAAEAALPSTAQKGDLEALRIEVKNQLQKNKWSWSAPPGYFKEKLDRMKLGDLVALRQEVGSNSFAKSLEKVKTWVNGQTYIEIRGCKIGENDAYLKGIQEFFGTAPNRLPSISAPKLYQFFGIPGTQVLPEGGKSPPVADSLKFLFEETFNDASLAREVQAAVKAAGLSSVAGLARVLQHADIKSEFDAWWAMKQSASGVQQANAQKATLKDFQDFMTTAPARTFPVNAPGVSANDSRWYLFLLPSSAIEAMLNWIKDQGYKLPGGKDPLQELFGGKKEWNAGRFETGKRKLYVDWLGDSYPVPKKIFFPEDPEYRKNIQRLPGSGTGQAKPTQPTQATQPQQQP